MGQKKPNNLVKVLGLGQSVKENYVWYMSKRRNNSKLSIANVDPKTNNLVEQDSPLLIGHRGSQYKLSDVTFVRSSNVLHSEFLTLISDDCLHIFEYNDDDLGIHAWERVAGELPSANGAAIVDEYKNNGRLVAYYSNRNGIQLLTSTTGNNWERRHHTVAANRPHNFDNNHIQVLSARRVPAGILVTYWSWTRRSYRWQGSLGAILCSASNPEKVLWRSEGPLWSTMVGAKAQCNPVGVKITSDWLQLFIETAESKFSVVEIPNPFAPIAPVYSTPKLDVNRHHNNPIITPDDGEEWESVGTFNPAVLHDEDGKVHILYRALDARGISYVGYAASDDGFTITERLKEPCYWPRTPYEASGSNLFDSWSESYASGGGWGGCEDPKVTQVDDTVYLTYVAHNGSNSPRLAMSTIHIEDFLAHKWDEWSEPRLISEPGVTNKSGVILPEKINGTYVVFHRVFPNILIHYTDDLDKLGTSEWLETHDHIPPRPHSWDSRKLSIGATPIRIDEGWLVIYHAVDDKDDGRYKIGAMILDADDPAKVLARSQHPILEPETAYENEWKFGIAYPSGAAIINGELFIYYGGGDRHVCVAHTALQPFVDKLLGHQDVTIKPTDVITA